MAQLKEKMALGDFFSENRVKCFLVKNVQWIAVILLLFLGNKSFAEQFIQFKPLNKKSEKQLKSAYVTVDSHGTLATVVEIGADLQKATLVDGDKKVPLTFLVNEVSSRLAIYKLPKNSEIKLQKMVNAGSSKNLTPSVRLQTQQGDVKEDAALVGRLTRFRGHVLPVAVLQLNHKKKAPLPGSGVYDLNGKLVAIVRQQVYESPKSSYCLPIEVLDRTLKDFHKNKKVQRCWAGIVMDDLDGLPFIISVRPDSPASKAGLKKGDVLLSVGGALVFDYPDVVDSFFYLIKGERVIFRVLRGIEEKEISVLPSVLPPLKK